MTRIDRYILFLYFRVFLICFLTLSGLLIVVQVFTNLDEFIQYGRQRGNFALALAEYFSPYLLTIYDRMCGLLTLLATMFVVAWLYRTNEMTAILAAGISKGRVIRSIMIASAVLILLAAVSRELLIPSYASTLSKNPQDLQGERTQPIRPTEDLEKGVLIAGRNLQPATNSILQPVFKFSGPAIGVTRQITGTTAKYLPADNDHPQGFLVSQARPTEPFGERTSIRHNGDFFLMLPIDNAWLKADECFIPTTLEYDILRGGTSKQFASTSDLIWRLRHQSKLYGADLKVSVHARFLQPLIDYTQLLIGLPMILSNRNRNLVGMIISSILSFGIFFAVSIGIHSLGTSETLLSPSMAAWAPLLIFGPLAYAKSRAAMQS